jgi:transcriptional regulator with XRE-family HTH domain
MKYSRSQGAVVLARTGLTQEAISARTGISRPRISHYMTGQRKPGPANRAKLQRAFGIEPGLWDVAPVESIAVAPTSTGTPAPASVFDMAGVLQTAVNDQLQKLTTDPSVTPYERSKLIEKLAEALHSIGKLTGETLDMSEERLLRLPAWRRVKDAIFAALRPWPEAKVAVAEALEALGR